MKSFKLLGVTADSDIRFERTLKSSEELKDVDISRAKFDSLAEARSELDVPALISKADAVVHNIEGIDILKLKVDQALEMWKS
ncbi:hypothetical protein D3C75_1246760 [compost metagenome]